jgi:hypothetical protein
MNEYVHQNPRLWGSYQAEVQNVRRYMKERITWMDNKLGYVYVPSGINMVLNEKEKNSMVYDLSGRPVNASSLKAGLYISNGKKFVVK